MSEPNTCSSICNSGQMIFICTSDNSRYSIRDIESKSEEMED